MGSVPYALGRQLRFFCKKEPVASLGGNFGTDTQEALTGANAAKVLSTDMSFSVERVNREDSTTTRSLQERVTGKQDITWSAECYLLPAGGTAAPDIDPLLEGAFGVAFGTSGTHAGGGYKLSDGTGGATGLPSLHLMRTASGVVREDIFGAWVESWGLSVSGGAIPTMTFSGGAMHYAMTGTGTTGTGATATTLPTTSGGHVNFMKGSVLTIADTGGEHVVTSVTTDALTIASATFGSAKAILPSTYTESGLLGKPVASTAGSITIGGSPYDVMAFDVTMANGIKPLNDGAFVAGASDYIPMARSVTGTVTIRAKQTDLKAFGARTTALGGVLQYPTTAINVTIGNNVGGATAAHADAKSVKVLMPTCELDFSNISIPAAEEAVLNIPFTALASSAGANDIALYWNV